MPGMRYNDQEACTGDGMKSGASGVLLIRVSYRVRSLGM